LKVISIRYHFLCRAARGALGASAVYATIALGASAVYATIGFVNALTNSSSWSVRQHSNAVQYFS
jgi:hypothetical protein